MNTTPTNPDRSVASGIHRGVWIGGGLMALTIIALATTLVVKNNDSLPDPAAGNTAAPAVAANTTPGAPATEQSSVANQPAVAGQAPVAPPTATPPPHEALQPVHHTPIRNAQGSAYDNAPQQVAALPACDSCGVIEGYSAVKIQGENNGVGAVAGGVGGALVGSQIAGRHNHTLGGLLGAVGGGLLGNAIETHQRTTTVYDVRVRMADGSLRTLRQATVPHVGQRVSVEGHALRPIDGQG